MNFVTTSSNTIETSTEAETANTLMLRLHIEAEVTHHLQAHHEFP